MHKLNEFLSIILKSMAIGAISIGVLWFALSIWGNIDEGLAKNNDITEMPDPPVTAYEVVIAGTNQPLYTDSYTKISDTVHKLSGYYELNKGKWEYKKTELLLDEFYYGDIIVRRR